ncbi:Heat shock protein 15 [Hartmannibacter diazotrophicus]|uniref:Heat shock protein 15 n=1 Tax=Hartmannibacter diazotrophicus TaxID=1482074 RepID=A0A2C9DE09_9HYPH|nr:RNA-binding S4 domain-containing protein [Hartmannibacter diazotrophicus]SON57865.1 Heat shock protein 15 [Hartmannibacter diazotrophicus]
MKDGRIRIDKWLWFVRAVKTRTLAAKLASSGQVRVNRDKIDSASHPVKVGDVLTFPIGNRVRVLKVVDLGERRGPASEAALLYEDLSPAPVRSVGEETGESPAGDMAALQAAAVPVAVSGEGRPTKKARRQFDKDSGRG